jgi:CO dehydrogenase/acetyl-CoA synthase epsilon subunit
MSDKNITIGNETRPMTAEEEAKWSENVAKIIEKDNVEATAQAETKAEQATLKASAKAKLIAGEALTEDEANTIVL